MPAPPGNQSSLSKGTMRDFRSTFALATLGIGVLFACARRIRAADQLLQLLILSEMGSLKIVSRPDGVGYGAKLTTVWSLRMPSR